LSQTFSAVAVTNENAKRAVKIQEGE
jgi:hypothetical protein